MSSDSLTDASIYSRIKEERSRLKVGQAEIAALAGVARETLSRYESGALPPRLSVFKALAQAGADIQYIVTGIRSAQALSRDEVELIEAFRAAPLAVKAAAIGALQGGSASTKSKQVVHGSVGQQATGDVINQKGVKIEIGNTEKTGGRRKR